MPLLVDMAVAKIRDSTYLFLVLFVLIIILSKVEGKGTAANDLQDLLSLKAKLSGLVENDVVEFDDASDSDSGFDDFESSIEVQSNLNEKNSYFLYNLFKATQEKLELDDKANEKIEDTKKLLSGALRARCGKYDRCMDDCYRLRAGYGCEFNCQKVFDQLNACETTKTTTCRTKKTTKCGRGRTMPPRWLLRMLANAPAKK